MFSDNTLTPREAVRLCALGILAQAGGKEAEALGYAELAAAIRHFTGHILGPSLDLMGTSIELLKYEGLAEESDDGNLIITEDGRMELHGLLTANLRAAATELNKLIIALKFRFLHLLEQDERAAQADLLLEVTENELTRLTDLRGHHADDGGHLCEWLDHDMSLLESRLDWLRVFRGKL